MPRVCTVCVHEERAAIDRALVGGTACREVAALYRVSADSVERHAAKHLPKMGFHAQTADFFDALASKCRSLNGKRRLPHERANGRPLLALLGQGGPHRAPPCSPSGQCLAAHRPPVRRHCSYSPLLGRWLPSQHP